MTEAIKFTFDEMFEPGTHNNPKTSQLTNLSRRKRWTDEDVEVAKEQARIEGRAEAHATQEQKNAEDLTLALGRIVEQSAASFEAMSKLQSEIRADAATLSLSIAQKLADALIALHPEVEIEAVIRECLTHLNHEPQLVIRVNTTLVERIGDTIQQAASERGMGDKMMIVGDKNITIGDCAIEWSNGGATRDRAELDRQVLEIITRYVETTTEGESPSVNQENPNV